MTTEVGVEVERAIMLGIMGCKPAETQPEGQARVREKGFTEED